MPNINLVFVANYGPYRKGDTANFPPTAAEIILGTGAAHLLPPPVKPASVADFVERRTHTKSKLVKK
jgi:hypothetical protein